MKYAYLIKLTVFSREGEDAESILGSLLKFFPFNLEENKIPVKKTSAEGFNKKEIKIFEVALAKQSLTNEFLESLAGNLEEIQKGALLRQSESKLDNNLDFFIRFDKDSWIKEKKLLFTDSGDCFHLKISIAAFPRKREVALKVVNDLFGK